MHLYSPMNTYGWMCNLVGNIDSFCSAIQLKPEKIEKDADRVEQHALIYTEAGFVLPVYLFVASRPRVK